MWEREGETEEKIVNEGKRDGEKRRELFMHNLFIERIEKCLQTRTEMIKGASPC